MVKVFYIDIDNTNIGKKMEKILEKYTKNRNAIHKQLQPLRQIRRKTGMHGDEVDKLFKELWKLDKEQREEELLVIKNFFLKKYKKNIKDGDLIEDIGKSGYRTSNVYIISKKEEIKVLRLGDHYDDYGYVDGDLFSLSPEKRPGYWRNAPFKYAYWNSEVLPEPISVKYWKNPSPDKITSLPSGKSILNIGWAHLKFPCSKERLLFFLLKAQKQVKALYFIPDYSEPEYFDLLDIETYFMPNDLQEILLGNTSIDKNELEKMLRQQKPQQKSKQKEKKKETPPSKKNRPSPSQSATLFQVGFVKKGNDGNLYQVKENKNKVKRWVKKAVEEKKPTKDEKNKTKDHRKQKKAKKQTKEETKNCPPDKILNPATNRCVSKTSKIGKELSKK